MKFMHKKFQVIIAYEYIIERTLDLYAKDLMKRIKHEEQDRAHVYLTLELASPKDQLGLFFGCNGAIG